MVLKIIGGIIVAFGFVDFIGSFAGFDVWTDGLRINLPEVIWRFTAYIEFALGYFLFKLGSSKAADAAEADAEVE